MKTTIDISNTLFKQVKQMAGERGTSLKEIFESALRDFLGHRKQTAARFKLKKASFKGKGVAPGVAEGDWTAIRDKIYEGRGA